MLLEAQKQGAFPLSSTVILRIKDIKMLIADACLALPCADSGQLLLETEASGYAIVSALSQSNRPVA